MIAMPLCPFASPLVGVCRLGLAVLAALLCRPAGAEECHIAGHDHPPQVRLDAAMAEPVYFRTMNKSEMTARHGLLMTGQTELGLTTSEVELEVRPKMWFQPQPGGGRGCAVLDSVDVVFRIEKVRVDIASDFPTDSCAYRVILDHENQHVAFTRQAFGAVLPEMRRLLAQSAALRRSQWVPAHSNEAALRAVLAGIEADIRPAYLDYQREARRLNASIDTPQSYRALHQRCRQW